MAKHQHAPPPRAPKSPRACTSPMLMALLVALAAPSSCQVTGGDHAGHDIQRVTTR